MIESVFHKHEYTSGKSSLVDKYCGYVQELVVYCHSPNFPDKTHLKTIFSQKYELSTEKSKSAPSGKSLGEVELSLRP